MARKKEGELTLAATTGRLAKVIEEGSHGLGIPLPLPPEEMAIAINAMARGIFIERLADPDGVPDDLFGIMLMRFYGIPATGSDDVTPGE